MVAGVSDKPWICHRWWPGSGLGKELHGGLALAADVHRESCLYIQGGACSGLRQKHEGGDPLQLLTVSRGM